MLEPAYEKRRHRWRKEKSVVEGEGKLASKAGQEKCEWAF